MDEFGKNALHSAAVRARDVVRFLAANILDLILRWVASHI
jgi:hypothetical protein